MAEHGWDKVKEKFNAALSLSVKERELYLKQLSSESTQLHHEVAELLAHHESADDADFLQSLNIGKTTEADLAETIAAGLPTIDMQQPDRTVSLAGMKTLDTKEVTIDLKLKQPNSLDTISTAAPIDESPYLGEIGDYLLMEQIGRGGMGVVYKAYQKTVGRTVALKVIAAGSLCAPEDIARFHDEASAAGRLNHPGIVPVYDAGEHNGTHYFSMAYVEGESLASYVGPTKPRLEPRKAAALIESICRAVQYAHDRAIIHRDIKPANIMLDKSGQPLLTDFGLAKLIGNEGLTMTGQVMGTPNYMAPEQAKGAGDLISNRTDVYSLGATLYALLAGVPAFVGKTLIETLRKVESASPASLAFKGSPVPLDLWIICEKCLAKRPEDRYESAGALADDLQRFLHGFPISARKVGHWTRLVRWSQRNPVIATLVAAIAATLVIATVVSTSLAIIARANQALAEKTSATAQNVIDELLVSMSESALAEVPGTQFIREQLLRKAQQYYDELNSTQEVSPEAIARAAFSVGRLQASLRRYDEAQKSYSKVIDYHKQRADEHPQDAEAASALGKAHYEYARLGQGIWNQRDLQSPDNIARKGLADMLSHAEESIKWRTKAHELDPTNREYTRLLANATMGLGQAKIEQQSIEFEESRFEEVDKLFETAQLMRNDLLSEKPDDGQVQTDLALGYVALADLRLAEANALDATQESAQKELVSESAELREGAIEVFKSLAPEDVTDESRADLANCYQTRASNYYLAEDYEKAVEYYEEMGLTLQPVLLKNPGVYRYRKGVADAQFSLAQIFLKQGDNLGWDYVTDFQKTLVNALIVDPRNHDAIDLMINYTESLADSFMQKNSLPEALRCLEQAKEFLVEAQASAADGEFIQANIKRIDEKIETLKADDRVA